MLYYGLGNNGIGYSIKVDSSFNVTEIKMLVDLTEAAQNNDFLRLLSNKDEVFNENITKRLKDSQEASNTPFGLDESQNAITIAFVLEPGSNDVRYLTTIPFELPTKEEEVELRDFLGNINFLDENTHELGDIRISMRDPEQEDYEKWCKNINEHLFNSNERFFYLVKGMYLKLDEGAWQSRQVTPHRSPIEKENKKQKGPYS